jgi:serine/threonine-protein kinase
LGVVHRDVSPQNVLIAVSGNVCLADFGVAKARGQLRRPTETGEIKGKLSYMSPEQISSKDVDGRADVFALACVMYEAALGVRAFRGGDALSTMYQILEEPVVAPRAVDPDFPPALEDILLKALAKDANARHQTAAELREALAIYLRTHAPDVSDRSVAAALDAGLGGVLSTRNRQLRSLAQQLQRGEAITAPVDVVPSSPNSTTPGGLERSAGTAPRSPSVRRGATPWLAAGLSLALLLAGGALLSRRAAEQRPVNATATRAPPPSLAPLASVVAPPRPSTTPSATALARENEVEPDLERGSTAAQANGVSKAPRSGVVSKPAPKTSRVPAAAAPVAAPVPSGELPRGKKPSRPPRSLDHDNPFGTQ